MTEKAKKFIEQSDRVAFDLVHRKTIRYNMTRYEQAASEGLKQFSNLENARCRAANIKHKVIDHLDEYLIEFESNFKKRGGKVIWAPNKKEAVREIINILRQRGAKLVVKSKSMISEEIELNDFLEKYKIESVETDLGEFIVQIAGERPYHIVTPAMHKSKEDVARLFNEKFGTPETFSPPEITAFVRELLREKFLTADAGITGANFLIADIGAIALTENEGNAFMSFSFPKLHIVIAGIEKIIPSIGDLNLFWPLLASHGTGQKITVYSSILTGPKKDYEVDGPEEMIVVLLDNNRSELLKQDLQRRALSCIRCGACLNACPVYRNIGGHTYETTYTGPIGSVIAPYMLDFEDYIHLSYASSLCGKCTSVCPVKINLHELLLFNRNEAVKRGYPTSSEKLVMKGWKNIMKKRSRMDMLSAKSKNKAMNYFFRKSWGPRRTLPMIKKKSFRELWMENA
jgi:L-lactate dehydrogenase complex protein LldF